MPDVATAPPQPPDVSEAAGAHTRAEASADADEAPTCESVAAETGLELRQVVFLRSLVENGLIGEAQQVAGMLPDAERRLRRRDPRYGALVEQALRLGTARRCIRELERAAALPGPAGDRARRSLERLAPKVRALKEAERADDRVQ